MSGFLDLLLNEFSSLNEAGRRTHLDDHGVDLVGGELKLVPGEGMSQTKLHGGHIFISNTYTEQLKFKSLNL